MATRSSLELEVILVCHLAQERSTWKTFSRKALASAILKPTHLARLKAIVDVASHAASEERMSHYLKRIQ